MLSDNEKKRFSEQGVIGPFPIYTPDEAQQLLRAIRRKNLDTSRAVFNNNVNYDRHLDIAELSQHVLNAGIVSRVTDILGPNLLCWRTEFFPKFPNSRGTEWHQVATYQYANGVPMLQPTVGSLDDIFDLTVWTAFTDTTINTACMRFIPGSHRAQHYDESKPVDRSFESASSISDQTDFYGYHFSEFKIDPEWQPEQQKTIDIEMRAGECILFSARCVHASRPNLSDHFTRFAISSRYVPTHVKVYPNTEKFYAHGAWFDLKDYGALLVAGKDDYCHNRIRYRD